MKIELTLSFVVDEAGARLLPGWPGSVNPDDPSDADEGVPGVVLAFDRAASRTLDSLMDELPTVLGAAVSAITVAIGESGDEVF